MQEERLSLDCINDTFGCLKNVRKLLRGLHFLLLVYTFWYSKMSRQKLGHKPFAFTNKAFGLRGSEDEVFL